MTSVETNTASTADKPERGTLPDAPLAMPKQVLETGNRFSLRRMFAERIAGSGV